MIWEIQPFHRQAQIFAKELNLDELLAHLLLARGIDSIQKANDFLTPDYEKHLHDPFLFPDLASIVRRIEKAIKKKEKIGVFGDYDADGVTGSAVLREALEGLGLEIVVHIPDKHKEGHGLSYEGIQVFEEAGIKLFFTVDCGITNKDEIAFAKKKGLDCIVVDHHHVPEIMPDALAIINPKIPHCGYPFNGLCGAGTAFKVAQGLYQKLAPEKEDQLKWLLDIVAIGTVADCMPIIDENRIFVRYGSVVLAKTRRVGLRELYTAGRIPINDSKHPDAMMIAFQIAPRINAAGRMAHARLAHDLLVETNKERAYSLAQELENHNTQRKKLSDRIVKDVRQRAKNEFEKRNTIVVADKEYPLGIVGLIAGKIAEEFSKPTIVLAEKEDEDVYQGSLRSSQGVNLMTVLEECSHFLEKYGGHAQAAGLTVKKENFKVFSDHFEFVVTKELGKGEKYEERLIDAEIFSQHITLEFLKYLHQFSPFGEGNPEPIFFIRDVLISDVRFLGNSNQHLKLKIRLEGEASWQIIDAIGFSLGEKFSDISVGEKIHLVGRLRENEWNGKISVQITIEDIRRSNQDDTKY
ncbi:MAG: single-stranded-DNA-specific exonuclease RecJ [Candidatus Moraniibacteriota bacterium]|nr:MAG: single-stranded-DNA-specific exonuclease RecJ [Candidatus Moranbacteria bacterium]